MLDLTRFKVLTFDCYVTMVDWETGILSALRPGAHLGVSFVEAGKVAVNERADRDILRSLRHVTLAGRRQGSSAGAAGGIGANLRRNCVWIPVDQFMESSGLQAFAMAEKVMVVAGMLGNTVASTACILCQPGSRPSRSVWNPRGSWLMGKLPPLWKLRPGSAILSITGSGIAPRRSACLQSLKTSLRTRALTEGFNSARSSKRSLPVS
jgi:hypothetical protein